MDQSAAGRVLYVDPDPGRREATARALADAEDLTVATADSTEQAVGAVDDGRPDCIVAAVPDEDGLDRLDALGEVDGDRPVLAVTDRDAADHAREAIANGADDVFRRHDGDGTALLVNRVRTLLEQDRSERPRDEGVQTPAESESGADGRESVLTVFENVEHPVVTGQIDEDGAFPITGVNEAFESVFGYAAEKAIGRDIADVIVPPGGRERHGEFREMVADGEALDAEVERLTTDGPRDFLVHVMPYEAPDGEGQFWYAWYRDITERRNREQRLRQYRQVVENQNDISFILDRDGRVTFVIDQATEVLAMERADLLGVQATAVLSDLTIDPDAPERFSAAVGDVLDGQRERSVEIAVRTEPLGEITIDLRLTPYRPEDGIEGVVGTARDISDRKERKRELRAQKAKIEELHDVAAEIKACESAEEVYDRTIEATESILEYDIALVDAVEDGMLVPKAVSSNLAEDHYYDETPVDAEDNVAAEVYRSGEPSVIDDVREHAADPASVAFRSALTVPIGEHGIFQTVGRSVGAFDESDRELVELLVSHTAARLTQLERERELREQTEELRRQNERLDQFASIVSHDLRNPLNVAGTYLELAGEDCESEYLDEVRSGLDRMEQLIDDLLTLAREGQEVSTIEPVSLDTLVTSCWHNVDTGDATLASQADRPVRADRRRLKQLLENLIRNAVEHGSAGTTAEDGSESGGDGVNVTIGELDDGFYVADDGPGIPADEREQVFEVGYTTTDDGTGFGLSIVEEIVTAHDWDIEVTESENGGAKFEITGVERPDT